MEYRCPSCGASLKHEATADALVCPSCANEYPNRGGFYDFLSDDTPTNRTVVSLFDAVSRIYETPVWYPLAMRTATGGRSSADELVKRVAERVVSEEPEAVLDVACGTGLFARGVATERTDVSVHGIDASAEMLRRAVRKARREGVVIQLARADAGRLPYADGTFDAATLCGALHLLPEPETALSETVRVLRDDGVLVVTTLVDEPPFGASPLSESMRLVYGMTVFDSEDIDEMFADAGYEVIEKEREASLATVVARL